MEFYSWLTVGLLILTVASGIFGFSLARLTQPNKQTVKN